MHFHCGELLGLVGRSLLTLVVWGYGYAFDNDVDASIPGAIATMLLQVVINKNMPTNTLSAQRYKVVKNEGQTCACPYTYSINLKTQREKSH